MTRTGFILALFLLAACGADGPPEAPAPVAPAAGVTVGGDLRLGVTGTLR